MSYIGVFMIFILTFFCDKTKAYSIDSFDRFGNSKASNFLFKTKLTKDAFRSSPKSEKFLNGATKNQPLYVNFKIHKELGDKFKIYKNKKVLFYYNVKNKNNNFISLRAINLESYETILDFKLGISVSRSTGIISLKNGKLYFLTKDGSNKKILIKKNTYFYGTHHLNSIDLDGKNHIKISLDLDKINNTYVDEKYKINPSNYLARCKTAINADFESDKPYLIFGCSNGEQYSQFKNLRGSLLKFSLDEKGEILEKTMTKFFPSASSSNVQDSKDAGIYLSGAAPTILNGFIYLSTGNGSINKKNKNFGCSVLKLEAETLKVVDQYSLGRDNSFECYFYNIDFSSSAIAGYNNDESKLISLRSKDGVLRIFNAENLKKQNSIRISNQAYGAPVFYKSKEGNTNIVVSSYSQKVIFQKHSSFIVGRNRDEKFLNGYGYSKNSCVGYLPLNNKKLKYAYSGEFRDQLLLIEEESKFYEDITSWKSFFLGKLMPYVPGGKYWPSYFPLSLGLSDAKNYDEKKFSLIKKFYYLDGFFIKNNFMNKKGKMINASPVEYLIKKKNNCNEEVDGYVKIYSYMKKPIESEFLNDSIYVFKLSKDFKLLKKTHYKLSDIEKLGRSNISVAYNDKKEKFLLFSTIKMENKQVLNYLNVFDLTKNRIIRKFKIAGNQHFSNSILVDGKLIVPNLEGINIFSFN